MKLYHIAAISENNVIGAQGKIPWRIPEDLRRFKEITEGHPVIMGRLTYEAMMPYAPLPNRLNIILSNQDRVIVSKKMSIKNGASIQEVGKERVALTSSIEDALDLCRKANEVFIIGGGSLYKQTLPLVDELRITLVHQLVEGDAYYPEIDPDVWVPSFIESGDKYSYIDYVRKGIRGS